MISEQLSAVFDRSPRLSEFGEALLLPGPRHIYLSGIQGSAASALCVALRERPSTSGFNHVLISRDAESAAYLHNDIENLSGALDISYFPGSFKNKKNFNILNSSHVVLRTEALTKWAHGGGKKVIVTYPEALFEKVAQPQSLRTNLILLKSGDVLALDSMLERMVNLGFERTDFVFEPGQFALRGGILDIYSFGNEKPYRVELFGNQVDSIRIFDPETQLSERRLLQVNIIPHVQSQLTEQEKMSVFDFFPENTLFWIEDPAWTFEKIREASDELQDFLQNRSPLPAEGAEESLQLALQPGDTVSAEEVQRSLDQRKVLVYGNQVPPPSGLVIPFATRAQPAFNRQFNLLIKDLKQWESQGFDLFIFAENPAQLERLHTIFEDLQAAIRFHPLPTAIHEGYIDLDNKAVFYTDHQIFQRYHKYRVRQAYNKNKALTLRTLRELQPGDYVTHIDHGVGRYSGLQKMEVNGRLQEAVRIIYKDNDILYVNINSLHKISKYTGKEGTVPKINKLGSDAWAKLKEKTKSKVKEIAFDLIQLYAQRKAQQGFAHSPDTYLQTELEASFIYEDTPDQGRATQDVKKDMQSTSPMDRLVCGDVGFGKTEIGIRAAFKSCCDGKQVAVLVPTTILAFQHYKTFSDRLRDFPVNVDYLNRFKSSKEKKDTLRRLQEGKIDIIIGTHALLGKDVVYKDLGLLIVDEEQKFGVGHKEKIKTLRTTVDCLTLTATPIPRTLQFSLMGARDLSIMNTPPPNRQPIQTEVHSYDETLIRDAIYYETERGGQVFFIHNRVQGLQEMATIIQGLCPDLSIGTAHGQMEGHELEEKILAFIERKYDVLVCTNIVESGVDIPNVNTIIVNNAHHFGLSDLHQLRGRVGRSNRKAFCYLVAPSLTTLPSDSRKRLQTLEQHTDLGSGFQIAMRDLDIRGAGNLLGGEQSGFMVEIGFEMYQKILDEAIRELKRTSFRELFKEEISRQDDYVQDCTIDTDLEILIPDLYVENITERLALYTRLDSCESEEELRAFHQELQDRFGPVPSQVEDLFDTVRTRKYAVKLGFDRLVLKEEVAKCYFIPKADSPYFESEVFRKILEYLQVQTSRIKLRQHGKLFQLVIPEVSSMPVLREALRRMHDFAVAPSTAALKA